MNLLKKYFSWLLVLAPIVIHFLLFFRFSLNIPKWDDFAVIARVQDFFQDNSRWSFWENFFNQHNEHRIVLTRIIGIIDHLIFNQLNLIHLQFIGNLFLLVICFIFFYFSHSKSLKSILVLPFLLVFLNLSHWENLYWGMAVIQNIGVVLFSLLACVSYIQSSNKIFWPIIFSFISIFTSGNGFFIIPAISLLILLEKNYQKFFLYFGILVIPIFLYFYFYEKPPTELNNPVPVFNYFEGFYISVGSFTEGIPIKISSLKLSLITGFFLSFISVYAFLIIFYKAFIQNYKITPVEKLYLSGLTFIFFTLIILVIGRSSNRGLEDFLLSRYKIYSTLIVAFNYLLFIERLRFKRKIIIPFIVLLFGVYYLSIQHYFLDQTIQLNKFLQAQAFNSSLKETPSFHPKKSPFLSIHIPENKISSSVSDTIQNIRLESMDIKKNSLLFLGLKNEKNLFYVPLNAERIHSIRNIINYSNYYKNTPYTHPSFYEMGMKEGIFQVYLIEDKKVKNLNYAIDIHHFNRKIIETNW